MRHHSWMMVGLALAVSLAPIRTLFAKDFFGNLIKAIGEMQSGGVAQIHKNENPYLRPTVHQEEKKQEEERTEAPTPSKSLWSEPLPNVWKESLPVWDNPRPTTTTQPKRISWEKPLLGVTWRKLPDNNYLQTGNYRYSGPGWRSADDADLNHPIVITANETVRLRLDNYTLKCTGITVEEGATLEIYQGTLETPSIQNHGTLLLFNVQTPTYIENSTGATLTLRGSTSVSGDQELPNEADWRWVLDTAPAFVGAFNLVGIFNHGILNIDTETVEIKNLYNEGTVTCSDSGSVTISLCLNDEGAIATLTGCCDVLANAGTLQANALRITTFENGIDAKASFEDGSAEFITNAGTLTFSGIGDFSNAYIRYIGGTIVGHAPDAMDAAYGGKPIPIMVTAARVGQVVVKEAKPNAFVIQSATGITLKTQPSQKPALVDIVVQ